MNQTCPVLVFIEISEGAVRNSSLEAVSYAASIGSEVIAIGFGAAAQDTLATVGKAGASKVLHVSDDQYAKGNIQAYASALAEAAVATHAETVVLAQSSLGSPVAARLAVKMDASLAANVTELPDTTSNGFVVKSSIYTGKAFANIDLTEGKRIISIKKNAAAVRADGAAAIVEPFAPTCFARRL